jgi:sulfate permease, SulP family
MSAAASANPRWVQRWWPWAARVSGASLRADAMAGLLGMVLSLPQGIAFAALAGLPIEFGIYTSIVPTIVAALSGSSWHVTSGPTNALSLAVLTMVAPLAAVGSAQYIQLVLAMTLMVGAMQLLIGALRLGSLANFISPVALFGFTAGAALLIAIHALPDILGLGAAGAHGAGALLAHVAQSVGASQWAALVTALLTVAVAMAAKRWLPRSPHLLLGLLCGTAWAAWWPHGQALRVVGAIPSPWPQAGWPSLEWAQISELLGLALALTLVALGQSISIAKALAERSGQRIDPNREFIGQGLSNIVGACFSSYVACGSLNRSVPNYEAGAKTPLAAVFSAVFMLLFVGVASAGLARIPMAAIAGLLVLVAWGLLDVRHWRHLWRLHRRDGAIALATAVATVSLRMELAILLGTLLSLFAFLSRTAKPAMRTMGFDHRESSRKFVVIDDNPDALPECPQLKLLRMEGEVYFGAVTHVADRLHALRAGPQAPRHLLVMAKSMNFIDYAGAQLWAREAKERRAMGGDLYFHRPRPEVLAMWARTGFTHELGADHQFNDKRSAIASIVQRLDPDRCAQCRARTFAECTMRPGPPPADQE